MLPNFAPHMRVAFASKTSNTGVRSPGEPEMTFSTSLVAVCCSSASLRSSVRWRSSFSSRVFSMAITAWAAKVLRIACCLTDNGPGATRATLSAPIAMPSLIIGTIVTA